MDRYGRTCSTCKKYIPWKDKRGKNNFPRHRHRPYGFDHQCKECKNRGQRGDYVKQARSTVLRRVSTNRRYGYTVVYDPSDTRPFLGGTFSTLAVDLGRADGFWPEGMRFISNGVEEVIVGPELSPQRLVPVRVR